MTIRRASALKKIPLKILRNPFRDLNHEKHPKFEMGL